MPQYTIQTPSGSKVVIEADDEETAIKGAQRWYSSQTDKRPNLDIPLDPEARPGQFVDDAGQAGSTLDPSDPRMQSYTARYKQGQVDTSRPRGDVLNPFVVQDAAAGKRVPTGQWYIDMDGRLKIGGGGVYQAAMQADAAVRGAADTLTFGTSDEIAAFGDAAVLRAGDFLSGKGGKATFSKRYQSQHAAQKARDSADRQDRGLARLTGQTAAVVATMKAPLPGIPRAFPNATGIVRAGETTARNAMAGSAMGAMAGAGNAEDGHRLEGAGRGALVGGLTGAALTPVLAGGQRAINAMAIQPAGRKAVGSLARGDVNAIHAEADRLRSLDLQPALVDVTDERGRAMIRAAAARNTPARESAVRFAESRSMDLPDRMSRQARRVMSADPRTPGEIRAAATEARSARAEAAYGSVRSQQVQMAPETVQALRTDVGRQAIREAAMRERDPEVRAALNRLAEAALDNPNGATFSVGMADRLARVLQGKAQAASRAGDNDLAATFGGLARSVRDPVRAQVPAYDSAVRQFASDSGLVTAADVGESLMSRNTDEFAAGARSMSDQERALARAAGRRAIERSSGENIGSAPGVARRIAQAPEQRVRNRALLGEADAAQLEARMQAEADAVRNAQFVSPNSGSQTQLRIQDAEAIDGVIKAANAARGGVPGIVGYGVTAAANRLKTLGMSDRDVEALVEIAIDPNRLDEALEIIGQFAKPQESMAILRALRDDATKRAGAGVAP